MVAVGCAAFIGLTVWLGPFIRLWSWGVRVVVLGLVVMALLVAGLILGHAFASLLMYLLLGRELNRRTPKAKEKLADSLMSVSTATQSATLIGLFVFPLTAFIQTMVSGIDPVEALVSWWQRVGSSWMRSAWWPGWHTVVFLVLYWLPLSIGLLFRKRALDIYDQIAPPSPLPAAPAVAPTAQGTNEQPRIPAAGQTTHPSATGGSRRRRRHRGT